MQHAFFVRRSCLKLLMTGLLLPAQLWLSSRSYAELWMQNAFSAKTTAEALAALQISEATVQPDIQIDAPQKAENGAVVQVEIAVPAAVGNVRSLRLLADANPTPLIASFVFEEQMLPMVVTRIKLAQSGAVVALIAQSSGAYSQQRRHIIVLEDGCANSEREEPFASSMKLRARLLENGSTELKIIILHPMRTGRSKGDDGQVIAAHFMQHMQVALNGQRVLEAQTGTAIARNPYFTFYLSDAKVGDVVSVQWQDNRGLSGQGETKVSV